MYIVIGHYFYPSFSIHFDPTSSLSFLFSISFSYDYLSFYAPSHSCITYNKEPLIWLCLLLVVYVIRHYFHPFFSVHFNPTSLLSLLIPLFFLMFIFLCFTKLTTKQQGCNTIGNNTLVYLLLTLAVRLPHNLCGYWVHKTVHFQFHHWTLCWYLSSNTIFTLLFSPFWLNFFTFLTDICFFSHVYSSYASSRS